MDAQDTQDSHADEQANLSRGDESETNHDVRAEDSNVAATQEHQADDETGAASPTRLGASSDGADAYKLQRAIDNLVNRIAEARTLGAARERPAESQADLGGIDKTAGKRDGTGQGPASRSSEGRIAAMAPQASSSEHHVSALELRMKQIADLAGPHPTEHLSVEIEALRGKIDRLSRLDGVLTGRLDSLQQQMSELRGALDTSSLPVIDRLAELEARLDEIGEALASRQLTGEARAAVEHSCSHIFGAIARIEEVARQAAPPKGVWDRIAATRDLLARMPTVDDIAVLEKSILAVSEKLVEVAEHGKLSDELATLETRLTDVVAATKVAVDEIRERPTLDHTKIRDDVHTLLQNTEAHIGDMLSSESGVKIDAIARKVDQLSQADNVAGLKKVQNGLSDLAGIVSAQSTHLSRLNLAGLQHRLARICDKLAVTAGEAFEASEPQATTFAYTDYGHAQEDDEDREAAKQLAIRLAPKSMAAKVPRYDERTRAEPMAEDVSGAFAAVRDALEALLGQVPYIEDMAADDSSANGPSSEPGTFTRGSDGFSASATAGPYGQYAEFARRNVDQTYGSEPGQHGTQPVAVSGQLDREVAEDASSRRVVQVSDAADGGSGSDKGAVSIGRVGEADADAADLKLVPSTESAESRQPGYGGAIDSFGTFSTWRKAKVAIVNANTPKD